MLRFLGKVISENLSRLLLTADSGRATNLRIKHGVCQMPSQNNPRISALTGSVRGFSAPGGPVSQPAPRRVVFLRTLAPVRNAEGQREGRFGQRPSRRRRNGPEIARWTTKPNPLLSRVPRPKRGKDAVMAGDCEWEGSCKQQSAGTRLGRNCPWPLSGDTPGRLPFCKDNPWWVVEGRPADAAGSEPGGVVAWPGS